MALRLGDVEKNHKKREEVHVSRETPTLRPWQGLEERDDIRRLKKAEILVARARDITKRNNEMARELREGFVPESEAAALELELEKRENAFRMNQSEEMWGQRVSLRKGFFSFVKDVFRPTELR